MDTVVLVVDDDAGIRDLVQDLIEQELEVGTVAAEDGAVALRQVALAAPSLIVLDLHLPVIDGIEVIRRVKADRASRDIPVVVMSAGENVAEGAEKAGCAAFVPKPFNLDLLIETIREHLPSPEAHSPAQRLRDILELSTRLLGHITTASIVRSAVLRLSPKRPSLGSLVRVDRHVSIGEPCRTRCAPGEAAAASEALRDLTREVVQDMILLLGLGLTRSLLGDLMP